MTTLTGTNCEACGTPLADETSLGRRRRFCDDKCRAKGRRQRLAGMADDPAAQLFALAVSAAAQGSGRSLRQLAIAMEEAGYFVSVSTLSQWKRGIHLPYPTEPIRHRLFMLERFGQRHTGEVVRALLATPGRAGMPALPLPRRVHSRPITVEQAYELLLERITEVDGSRNGDLVQVEQTEHYVVGDKRLPVRSDITLKVNALRTTEAYWHIHAYDPQAPATVEAGEGCTRQLVLDNVPPVRINSRTSYQLVATKLRFKEPLLAGKEHEFSFTTHYDPQVAEEPVPTPEFRRLVTTPATRMLKFSIEFDPRHPPRTLHLARWPLGRAADQATETLAVPVGAEGSVALFSEEYPELGGYGYLWTWPTDTQFAP